MAFLIRGIPLFALLLTLAVPAWGQDSKGAGVVTSLKGRATVSRLIIPQPIPLKVKDDVFVKDRIDTREDSIVRVLLGGKALITVRELSVLTITEEPNRAIVDLQSGKIALGLAKKLLKPGESIEIRTPNAIASVRGSYLFAACGGGACTFVSGDVTVPITIASRANSNLTFTLSSNQSVSASGSGATTTFTQVQVATAAQRAEAAQAGQAPKSEEGKAAAGTIISSMQAEVAGQVLEFLGVTATGTIPTTTSSSQPSTSTAGVQVNSASEAAREDQNKKGAAAATAAANAAAAEAQAKIAQAAADQAAADAATAAAAAASVGGTDAEATTRAEADKAKAAADKAQAEANAAAAAATKAAADAATAASAGTASAAESAATAAATDFAAAKSAADAAKAAASDAALARATALALAAGATTVASPVLPTLPVLPTIPAPADTLLHAIDAELMLEEDVICCSASFTSPATEPLVALLRSSLTAAEEFVRLSGVDMTLAGPLLHATDSSIFVGEEFLRIRGGSLTSTSPQPLVALLRSDLTVEEEFLDLGSSMTLSGPLLHATDSPIFVDEEFLRIRGGSLTSTSPQPLVALLRSSLTVEDDEFLNLSGGSVTLSGPFLHATDSSIFVGEEFLRIRGGSLSSTSTLPFVFLLRVPLTIGDEFLDLSGGEASVSLAGQLLRATDSPLSLAGDGVLITGGAKLTTTSSEPLVDLTGGEHSIGGAIFNLQGTGPTDKPLQHSGVLFQASGATVSAQNGLKIDPALLEATAPLFNLLNGGSITTVNELVKLTGSATLSATLLPGDALIKLNAATITVNNGSLFNVMNGSTLTVTGSLFFINNGSTIDVKNGGLATVAAGSFFSLTSGSLGVFGSTGTNTLKLSNVPTCGLCVPIGGGYQAVLVNGATTGNTTLMVSPTFTPFQGLGTTNTAQINGSTTPGPVIIVNGTGNTVKLGL